MYILTDWQNNLIKRLNFNSNQCSAIFCLSGPTSNLHRAKMDFVEEINFNSSHNEAKLPFSDFSKSFKYVEPQHGQSQQGEKSEFPD